jgi:hypothetical protein
MNGIADLVANALQGDTLANLSNSIGAPEGQTRDAAMAALPVLLGQMQRNAATPEGAASLAGALDRDHDGSLLDNVGPLLGMLGGGAAASRSLNGAGILGHIFGGRQGGVESGLSQATGLDRAQIGRLLMMLAPIVMAALARRRQAAAPAEADAGGFGGLSDLLGQATSGARAQAPGGIMGALTGLLDADRDGSVLDDLAGRLR